MHPSSEDQFEPADSSKLSVSGASALPADGDEELQIPPPSEIATRINLLGKLIVPPTPR